MKKEIIAYFKQNSGARIKSKKLAEVFDLHSDNQYEELKAQLHALVAENILFREGKRYTLVVNQKAESVIGTVQITRDGFGFVKPDSKKLPDFFIPEQYLHSAMNGDRVEVLPIKSRRKGKNIEGEIVQIIKRKIEVISGVLRMTKSGWRIVPDSKVFSQRILVSDEGSENFVDGDKVVVGELVYIPERSGFQGKVLRKASDKMTLDDEYMSVYSQYSLNPSFPSAVVNESEKILPEIPTEEISKRLDFRNEAVLTIDPVDAKDFDDALSVKLLENENYQVGIHIADVSHYVTQFTELDNEASQRGNSVYLCGKVVPMLPESLSNGICSLRPNEDRLTFSCIAELSPRGKVVEYKFAKTIINSKRRFTYDEVQQIIETGEGDFKEQILILNKLALTLRKKRMSNGSINFSTKEAKILLDSSNVPVTIIQEASNESHNLVEEFMLLANKLVAEFIKAHTIGKDERVSIFRIHDRPDKEKLANFLMLLKSLGYDALPPADRLKPKDINQIMDMVKGKPEEILINSIAIRAMAKAVYSTKNIGHYGLAFKEYTHFTSPIRRFSDLIAHRILFSVLEQSNKNIYSVEQLETICERITFTERNAMEAERTTVKMKKLQFMKAFIGEEFQAVISGVTNFGIFVEVIEYLSEGLIRLSDLDDDYYVYDEKKYSVTGRKRKHTYQLGDLIRVKLIRVDETKQEMDFALVTE